MDKKEKQTEAVHQEEEFWAGMDKRIQEFTCGTPAMKAAKQERESKQDEDIIPAEALEKAIGKTKEDMLANIRNHWKCGTPAMKAAIRERESKQDEEQETL